MTVKKKLCADIFPVPLPLFDKTNGQINAWLKIYIILKWWEFCKQNHGYVTQDPLLKSDYESSVKNFIRLLLVESEIDF